MRISDFKHKPILFFKNDFRIRADEHAWVFEKYYSNDDYEKWHMLHNSRWLNSILKIAYEYFLKRSSKNDLTEVLAEVERLMAEAMKSQESFLREYLPLELKLIENHG
jgi:hypothetical protein